MANKQLTFMLINKANSDLHSRIPEINSILSQHKPSFLVINELNLHHNDKISSKLFPGYTLVQDNLHLTNIKSRTGILVDKNIKFSRRKDLESQEISTVWLQLKQPNKKVLLIQGLYRQFNLLGNETQGTPHHQQARWKRVLDNWEKALDEGVEIITLGDCNLDKYQWDKPATALNPYQTSQRPMVTELHQRILSRGVMVLNNLPTRNYDSFTQPESCLDLLFSNRQNKIISHETITPTFSDHALLKLTRRTKELKHHKTFISTRTYTNYDKFTYQNEIQNHPLYIETFYINDPIEIASNIQSMIRESIDPLAPIVRLQLKEKRGANISDEAKELLFERDTIFQEYKKTGDPDTLRLFKNLRNQASSLISKENFVKKVKKFSDEENMTSKQKWKLMKEETGQLNFTTPTLIVDGKKPAYILHPYGSSSQ